MDQNSPPAADPRRDPSVPGDDLPGRRADLPEGTLRRTPPEPQGDENREPPAIAPTGPEPPHRVPPPQPPAKA